MVRRYNENKFRDHYEEMIYTLHPRDSVIENVDKMINCGDPALGGAMYGCPSCGKLKFVPFRCHSRFCPACGNLYAMQRTTSMSFKLVNVAHRHCVFTIDENLRDFFLHDRSLLNCLFHSVNSVVQHQKMSRLELLYTCVANLAKEVAKTGRELPEELQRYSQADDRNCVIYHNRSEETSEKISTVLKDATTFLSL